MMQSNVVALFDFDGTVTTRDSLLPFLWHLLGPWKLMRYAFILSPLLIGYALRLIPNGVAKERLLGRMVGGMLLTRLQGEAQRFARDILPRLVRRSCAERIAWHQAQGHRVIIVSASLELYLRPWAVSQGIGDVLATRLAEVQGRAADHFDGVNCYGGEKAQRVQEYLGDLSKLEIYAYGDSRGDREMLSMADHAYYRGELLE
ncbi:MAG: HAD-IB family hydrolase [Chromatiales bacterium]|nr:HAD-IB family hydrolase [Chromatiales bacterium]